MSHNVFANTWQIAAKSGMNKSIARFPDVCLSPPGPPAGPIPIPYPDTSFSSDLKEGSDTVKIGGEPASLAQQSYYKTSPLGNEAATRSFGASVVTHQITGKTYFQSWSMDIKIEGKNVCRHIDITTSNHGSSPPATPPAPSAETQSLSDARESINKNKCPCCGQSHSWQQDESQKMFEPMTENDFWEEKLNALLIKNPKAHSKFKETFERMKKAKSESRTNTKAGKPGCPNVHENEEAGCALYFNVPKGAKSIYTSPRTKEQRLEGTAKVAKLVFEDRDKAQAVAAWNKATGGNFKGIKLNHKTPSMAAGCNTPHNVVPETTITDKKCKDIEAWQSTMENINSFI